MFRCGQTPGAYHRKDLGLIGFSQASDAAYGWSVPSPAGPATSKGERLHEEEEEEEGEEKEQKTRSIDEIKRFKMLV